MFRKILGKLLPFAIGVVVGMFFGQSDKGKALLSKLKGKSDGTNSTTE